MADKVVPAWLPLRHGPQLPGMYIRWVEGIGYDVVVFSHVNRETGNSFIDRNWPQGTIVEDDIIPEFNSHVRSNFQYFGPIEPTPEDVDGFSRFIQTKIHHER